MLKISAKKAFLAGSLLLLAVTMHQGWAKAFLSDGDALGNRLSSGHLTTVVSEKFDPLTETPKSLRGKNVKKTVKFKNEGTVSCYIRVSVEFSSSDYDASLYNTENREGTVAGQDSGWMEKEGYYYYKNAVPPGGETSVLFDRIHFGNVNEKYVAEDTAFGIIVSEESISIRHGNTTFDSCMDAWDFHLKGRG